MNHPPVRGNSTAYMIRFLEYNLAFAFMPAIFSITLHLIGNVAPAPGAYAPELLFFAIMIAATALGDITDETRLIGNEGLLQFLKAVLLLGAVGSALVFGWYQYDSILGPGNATFRANITGLTFWIALFALVASVSTEILISRIHGESN